MSTADGKIIKGIGGNYYVSTEDGIVLCRARGKLRREELSPIVGDRVCVLPVGGGEGSIQKIYPRKNFLIRPSVANIDSLVLVCAAAAPDPDFTLIDKLLVIAGSKDIEGVVCINKTDLVSEEQAAEFAAVYEKAGYKTVIACAKEGRGADELIPLISGKTVAFAGLSGVGKSSLLSLITGRELTVGDISKIERGKHTTRHVELIAAHGGYVFDTPGFSRLEVEGVRADELRMLFPEMARLEGECRFRGCAHISEPGCAVGEALERGEIAPSRYESYKALYNILKDIKEWENK
ncbi:MAG: ribosome small subunit-dependent GTPase A [Clostridia bacterium]